jgi:hypothetical protein
MSKVAAQTEHWGKIGKELYGKLAAMAKQYLAITATSVPSERQLPKRGLYWLSTEADYVAKGFQG